MIRLSILFIFLASPMAGAAPSAEVFRFHLQGEPHSLDPQTSAAASGNYLFHNVYRGLFRYHSQRGLIQEGAKDCVRKPLRLTCHLAPGHRWSDGQAVTATDYVHAFRRLIGSSNSQSELLLNLLNARAILLGRKPATALGVSAEGPATVVFTFSEEDVEFEFKLTNVALSPDPPGGIREREQAAQMQFSGPFKISAWKPGHWVRLEANSAYGLPANPTRPPLEAVFVDNDSTALRLYEAGELSFLRRLASEDVSRFRGKPEFHQIPVLRFDYIGFGPQLLAHPQLREALGQALDYNSFRQVFDTKGIPGCPGLPPSMMDHIPCLTPAFEQAKKVLAEDLEVPKLEYDFSLLGGDDVIRGAEWFQAQWKKNLGLSMELRSQEQGAYLSLLRSHPPPIFRKGISLDRPTCLAALELFSTDSRENYIGFHEPKFEKLIAVLKHPLAPAARKVACRTAVEYLINSHRIIPLGEMQFVILASRKFTNWDLNELNQMDLTDLKAVQ